MTIDTTKRTDLEADKRRVLKQAAWAAKKATTATDGLHGAMVLAHELGASLREIAEATGIPHVTVSRIIERTRAGED